MQESHNIKLSNHMFSKNKPVNSIGFTLENQVETPMDKIDK